VPRTPILRARFQPPHSRSKRHSQHSSVIPWSKRCSRESPAGRSGASHSSPLCRSRPSDVRAALAGPHWGRRFAAPRNGLSINLIN